MHFKVSFCKPCFFCLKVWIKVRIFKKSTEQPPKLVCLKLKCARSFFEYLEVWTRHLSYSYSTNYQLLERKHRQLWIHNRWYYFFFSLLFLFKSCTQENQSWISSGQIKDSKARTMICNELGSMCFWLLYWTFENCSISLTYPHFWIITYMYDPPQLKFKSISLTLFNPVPYILYHTYICMLLPFIIFIKNNSGKILRFSPVFFL